MRSAILAVTLAAANASAAMILGFGAEADYYAPKASGNFSYTDKGVTTHTAFSNGEESTYQVGLFLEHPVPVLPNLRIDMTPENSFSGSNGLAGTNTVTFNEIDVTPYYEVLDNIVDIDIGVTLKVLDGKIEGAVNQSFSEVIPMGYLGAGLMFPGIPLRFAGSIKYVGFDGDSFSDMRIKAMWNIAGGVSAQAGYREESLKIKDRFGMNADASFRGPFFGVNFTF